jgi:hypothetical protein
VRDFLGSSKESCSINNVRRSVSKEFARDRPRGGSGL